MFGRTFAWKEEFDFGNALGFRSATILFSHESLIDLRHGPGPVHTLRSAMGAGPFKQATEKARETRRWGRMRCPIARDSADHQRSLA